MIRIRSIICLLFVGMVATGCDGRDVAVHEIPPPAELVGEEIGYYCNMTLSTHKGPKGQIILHDQEQPFWFTSVRDTIAFTLLPEEPRNISMIYVSDMGVASWDSPEPGTWVDANEAWYVIESDRVGGMGAPEPVPFALKNRAEEFRLQHGGRVVEIDNIPQNFILGSVEPVTQHSNMTESNEMDHTGMTE